MPAFILGAAQDYALLFEGAGSNNLQVNLVTTNVTGTGPGQGGGIGNIGVGRTGKAAVGGPSILNGRIDFSASNTGQLSINNPTNVITGGATFGVAAVTSALDTVNALNASLGTLPGPSPTVNGNTTINAVDGTFSASGTGYTNVRAFNINAFGLNNGQTLTINGDANGDSVVLNFRGSTNFRGNVALTGGLTPDDVIFNFVGGDLSGGGPSLDLNNGGGASNLSQGIFLNPNGSIRVGPSNVLGRIFGGDSRDMQFPGPTDITAPRNGASPSLATTPSPAAVTLGGNAVTLTDSATLSGGNAPTGTITFTLFHNGGGTPVDTETVTVNGNGTYRTPTGFTLPSAGAVTGTYQWDAAYSGDSKNGSASDNDAANEQVTVGAASPTISTTANPSTVLLGGRLQDVATLAGGYHPTGSITFRLYAPGVDPTVGPVAYTETVPGVNGNGSYSTTAGFVSNATGVWHWVATYGGDPNNNTKASGPLDEPVTIPSQADLALAKTVSNPTPNVGDTVTFTVTLTDKGPDVATGVQVTDLLPGGLTFVSSTPSQGAYDPVSGAWTVGTVDTSAPRTLAITARVVSSGARTNTATISHSDQVDPDGTNNTASATETPQQADLVVSKSVDVAHPNVGATINFLVTVSDAGPNAATGVQLTDLLPAGLTLLSNTPSQGTYNTATGLWSVGTLASGGNATLQLRAMVAGPAVQTNTAAISHSDQFDPNTGNNTASAAETPQRADLVITKAVSDPAPNVGATITYTLAVADSGPDTATGVAVSDLLPAGVTFVSADPSQGIYDHLTGVWTVGTVAVAATPTLTITVTVAAAGQIVNAATVSGDQFDPNTANNTAAAAADAQAADLALVKTVSNPTPNVGGRVTFTVTLTDAGPSAATGVRVTDLLPAGVAFVSSNPSLGTYTPGSGVWDVGTVTPGTPQTLVIVATVVSSAAQTNTATITASDQFDPNTGNNSDVATETPQQADLAVTKIVSDSTPNVGDTITFTVTLSNSGPNSATGVVLTDLLPAGLSYVSNTPSQGSYNPANGVWSVGTLASGPPATLTLRARVDLPIAQTNTAGVTHADQFDPTTGNNSAGATETPQRSDLAVTKSVSDPTPNVGDQITFTVTLSNAGPDTATGVSVSDQLPAGLTFVSATPSTGPGTYDSVTGVWAVGTVTTTTPQTLTILATVVSASPRTNTATISAADQFDPIANNNTSGATETPQRADLALTKSVSDPTPNVGEQITFTITLTNSGPSAASGVQLTDLLPAGLTLVTDDPSQGTYTAGTGLWDVGAVVNVGSATLTITATVDSPDARTNTATITASDQFDPDTGNDTASATETPRRADLVMTKAVSDSTPNVGETITYTLTVANSGPDTATGVTVMDLLPTGVTFVSDNASQGAYDEVTGLWTVGTLAVAATPTLAIMVTVNAPNQIVNTATVDGDQFDPNPGNNTSSTSSDPQAADLSIVKTVNDPTPNVGEQITFHVSLTNSGPHEATGVRVTDLLPAGVTFVSSNPSLGTYDDVSGLWDVGTVDTSTPQTLEIVATVVSASAQTNTATISRADQFDPNTANNSDVATETPQHADLALSKSVSDPTPNVGDQITFTVTLSNSGPDAATGVQVTDLLPAGLTFVSASPVGVYTPSTGVWDVGTVTPGTPQTLVIVATVVSPAAQTNAATVTDADQFDPNTANNGAAATETPQQSDLALTKTVSDPTPNVGDVITCTVTVTNNGPDTATGVEVTDELPPGLTQVSFLIRRGIFATQVWDVGTLESGASATLTLQARVDSLASANEHGDGHGRRPVRPEHGQRHAAQPPRDAPAIRPGPDESG